jgi:hypothetical protein
MNIQIQYISAFSILIPCSIALIRFRKLDKVFLPFIVLLWVGALNEALSFVLVKFGRPTTINNNIYVLCESIAILWFFKKIRTVLTGKLIFGFLISSFIVFWIIETFITGWFNRISSYFRIFYSFVIVILSISTVNFLIVTEKKALLKLPVFIISVGFIIFFTYKVLVEAFSLVGLNKSDEFRGEVYAIQDWLNLFVNLVYALAILWIPRKREYTLLS